jgi:DNA-binding NarL/FixJ family response regulator
MQKGITHILHETPSKCLTMSSDLYYTMNPVRIYLAEDDEDDVLLFAQVLEDSETSFLLSKASNGSDLIRDVQTNIAQVPDFIFLDMNMPKKNGFDTLQELRHLLPPATQMFMLSTVSDAESVQRALQLGANGYISKCIPYPRFLDAIRSILTGIQLPLLSLPDNEVLPGQAS